MNKHLFISVISFLFFLCMFSSNTNAQVAINTTGASPDNSAILDVQSTSKGMLVPRMTTAQIAGITNPPNGLIIFDTKKGLTVFTTGKGWGRLEPIPSGRIFVSDVYPDTLYPSTDYDYMGVFYQQYAFKKNYGSLSGGWVQKTTTEQMSIESRLLYTGSVSNKILVIGALYGYPCDSCMLIYDLATDSIYKDPVGNIRRIGPYTATMDTSNARIFIWGGYSDIYPLVYPEDRGYIYNYSTGAKVIMDSVTMPESRFGHSAIWAKSVNKLLVFGGYSFGRSSSLGYVNTLYAYDPATNTWTALATPALSARQNALAVYDGNDHMLIWGGDNGNGTDYFNGAVYTISTNTWTMMSSVNAPTRKMSNASWTGAEMLLSSPNVNPGNFYDYLAYRYNLTTNTWTAIPPIPSYLSKPTYVVSDHLWNGSSMLQLGYLVPFVNSPTNILWSYDPLTNNWTALAGPALTYGEKAKGVQAGSTTIFNNYSYKFFRYLSNVAGTPSYQVENQQFHYYKKK